MRVLILHDKPEDVRPLLESEGTELELYWATSPGEVRPELERVRPEAVFSIKHSGFPGEAHKPAVAFPTVRWFHVGGSGYDHLGRWDEERVTVTNSAGVLAPFHAERAVAALLALSTRLLEFWRRQQEREWCPSRFQTLLGKTLLVIGTGATGRELARRAAGLGMRVLGVNRGGHAVPGFDEVFCSEEQDRLWSAADVISLNVPLTEGTRRLCDASALARMRPGSLLLNASRGPVVDEAALVAALRSGTPSAAWLDVFEEEPLPPESPLWSLPNVLITPHCADLVADFPLRYARHFLDNLRRYRLGEELMNRVEAPASG